VPHLQQKSEEECEQRCMTYWKNIVQ
jgi:hypothetical protein